MERNREVPPPDDYYGLLGVSPFASVDEIRDSFKKLALRFHPDKNHSENATQEFQALATAWEALRDPENRRKYDRNYPADPSTRRKREDLNRAARQQWEANRNIPTSAEEAARLERARVWKAMVKNDYISRRQSWMDLQKRQIVAVKHYEILVRRYDQQMKEMRWDSEQEMVATFTQAIQISESGGKKLENHDNVIAALMEAKRVYTLNLQLACQASKSRLDQLLEEMENSQRCYEEEEGETRQLRVQEALNILGPRQINTPLFTIIDRRQQAINHWASLSRIPKASKFSYCSLEKNEGPWHGAGIWERIPGEYSCGRCGRPAFHIILDCGPAKCPSCGVVVCNNCHRDLDLLREYEAWVLTENDIPESLFSLGFRDNDGPIDIWDGGGRFARSW